GRDRRRLVEPEPRELVQHLALERDRADHRVERAQPVGDDDDALAPRAVDQAVADLAVVALEHPAADGAKRRRVERAAELGAERGVENLRRLAIHGAHDSLPRARSSIAGAWRRW